jgi:hypothetical protein
VPIDHVGYEVSDYERAKTAYAAFVLDLDGHNVEAVCHKAA